MKTHTLSPIQLGDAVEHRGIVIAPLFPRTDPRAEYLTLEQAVPLGFHVTELDAAGSVPELLATNPLDKNVLLYDGEELLGAKQNRILNVTVLVAAASETRIPVSCVEEGRWSTRSAHFAPSAQTAYPELRRRKAVQLSAAPLERGLAQHAVWQEVASKADRLGVQSPTRAQADIYTRHEDGLGALRTSFPLAAGQSGALFALGDLLCLDFVSRPDAFAQLYPKLLHGYLLDAIERLDGKATHEETLAAFLETTFAAPRSRRASPGLGEDVRVAADRLVGSGLELDGELIQLCVFSSEGHAARTRITPPSSRC
jgi:hypothetical protein